MKSDSSVRCALCMLACSPAGRWTWLAVCDCFKRTLI